MPRRIRWMRRGCGCGRAHRERLDPNRAQRCGDVHLWPKRNGPGCLHLAEHDPGRGAGGGPAQSDRAARARGSGVCEYRHGRTDHRWQHQRARRVGTAQEGGRDNAGDADRGGGGQMGRQPGRLQSREWRRDAWPAQCRLRQPDDRGGEAHTAGECRVERPIRIHGDRQAASPPRWRRQGTRSRDIRPRCEAAGDALCGDRSVSGAWRKGGVVRRHRGGQAPWREGRGEHRRRGGGGRESLLDCAQRCRLAHDFMGRGQRRQARHRGDVCDARCREGSRRICRQDGGQCISGTRNRREDCRVPLSDAGARHARAAELHGQGLAQWSGGVGERAISAGCARHGGSGGWGEAGAGEGQLSVHRRRVSAGGSRTTSLGRRSRSPRPFRELRCR